MHYSTFPPFYFCPDDGNGTLGEPPPTPGTPPSIPAAEPKHKHPPHVECGFCESRVTTMRGEVLSLSARAKALAKAEHEIETLKDTVERLRAENAALKGTERSPAPANVGGW